MMSGEESLEEHGYGYVYQNSDIVGQASQSSWLGQISGSWQMCESVVHTAESLCHLYVSLLLGWEAI